MTSVFTTIDTKGVTEAGARLQVTAAAAGEIPHVKATAALKLFTEVTVIVEVLVLPTVVVTEAGLAVRVKSGAARTFSV